MAKKFLVSMSDEKHEELKIESVMRRTTMNDIVLKAIDIELKEEVEEMKELLGVCYRFIKGGPASELEAMLKKYEKYALFSEG